MPEFIRIDQSDIGQFVGNLTQRFIGTRSNRETDDGFVSAVQSIGHPDMIFFTADKGFDLIDFIFYIAVTCGAVIFLEMEMILLMRVVVDISSNLAMPLIPTPSLIYSEIVRFNSGI